MNKKFKAKEGSHISDVDANRYGQELDKLIEKLNGRITTEQIVANASKNNSPLHDYFEWDDSKAGIEYRKHQARLLSNSIVEVKIINESSGPKEIEIPSFINTKKKKETFYVTIDTALTNESIRREYISKILKHLKTVQDYLELLNQL
jgi:hypothetical protein